MSYPVSVWALIEDAGPSTRQVVGIDAGGQWPGCADNDPRADFIRYIDQTPLPCRDLIIVVTLRDHPHLTRSLARGP